MTGSSNGIGKAIAEDFAKYGINLLLISKSLDNLQKVKESCANINPNIDVKLIPLDFSKALPEDYRKIF